MSVSHCTEDLQIGQPDQASDLSVIVTGDNKATYNESSFEESGGIALPQQTSVEKPNRPWYLWGLLGPYREVHRSHHSLYLDPLAAFCESFIPTRALIVCLNLTIIGNIVTDIWILFKLKGFLQLLSILFLLLSWRFGVLVQALNEAWDFGTGFEMRPIDFRLKWLVAGYIPFCYFPKREFTFQVPFYWMYDTEPWWWSDIFLDLIPKLARMELFLCSLTPVYPFVIMFWYAPFLAIRNWKFAARRIRQSESMMLVGFCDAVEAIPQVLIQYLAYQADDLNKTDFLISLCFSGLAILKVIESLILNITVLSGGIWRTQERCLWSSCKLKTLVDGFIGDVLLVKEINLNYNQLVGEHDWDRFIRQFKSLEILRIVGNGLDDKSAPCLAKAIARNKTIKLLDLEHNYIEDIGAEAFAEGLKFNSCLEVLNLENNFIGDRGSNALFAALQDNNSLKVINLSRLNRKDNPITDAGVKALANSLSSNHVLQEVNLRNNKVGDLGAVMLADALTNNNTIRIINLKDNDITATGAYAFNRALNTNKTIRRIDVESLEYFDNEANYDSDEEHSHSRELTQRLMFHEASPFHCKITSRSRTVSREATPCDEKMPMDFDGNAEMLAPILRIPRPHVNSVEETSRKIDAHFEKVIFPRGSKDCLLLPATDILSRDHVLGSSTLPLMRRKSMSDLELNLENYHSGYAVRGRNSHDSLPHLSNPLSSRGSLAPRRVRTGSGSFGQRGSNTDLDCDPFFLSASKGKLCSVPEIKIG